MEQVRYGDWISPMKLTMKLLLLLALAPVTAFGQTNVTVDAGRGPVVVQIPSNYEPSNPAPLLLLLHGYSFTGQMMENYFDFAPLAEQNGFIFTYPDGTQDSLGFQFWNATSACCDNNNSGVDDLGYLTTLLDLLESQYNIDPQRIHIVGHSNGGFMAHRMACEDGTRFASIVSLSGAALDDPAQCAPASPMHVLHIHGTLDPIILYGGGFLNDSYPSAMETCTQWAAHNGCDATPVSDANINFDGFIFGNETSVLRWQEGCATGGSVEFWSVFLGGHLPALSSQASSLIFQHLIDHPKPTAPGGFIRGDVGGDGTLDISDAIELLLHLFSNGNLDCREAANSNADGSLDISDVIYLLAYMFTSAPPPSAPFPGCGSQPISLDCLDPSCP